MQCTKTCDYAKCHYRELLTMLQTVLVLEIATKSGSAHLKDTKIPFALLQKCLQKPSWSKNSCPPAFCFLSQKIVAYGFMYIV